MRITARLLRGPYRQCLDKKLLRTASAAGVQSRGGRCEYDEISVVCECAEVLCFRPTRINGRAHGLERLGKPGVELRICRRRCSPAGDGVLAVDAPTCPFAH